MADLFERPKGRIARAKVHLGTFEAEMDAFFATNPYRKVVEPDPDTGGNAHKVKLAGPLPSVLTDLASEAVEALRSALDQAAFATAVAWGKKAEPKSTHFPVADDVIGLDNVIARKCKDLPPDIVTFFRGFKPYKGGNDLVWALNRIRNGCHTLLKPVGMVVGGMSGRNLVMVNGSLLFPTWNSEKDEIVLAITGRGGKFSYDNLQIAFFIALGDVDVARGKPALPVFNDMASECERIVLGTEAEARRIGLIA
jgi:hypothetical protein